MKNQTFEGFLSPEQRTALSKQFIGGALPLFEYAPEKCAVDGIIAAAHFLAPDFTLLGDCVFLTAIMPPAFDEASYREMEQRYHGDHSAMERWMNAWAIGSFFLNAGTEYMDDEPVLNALTDCLIYHWGQRLKALFPEWKFVFETGFEIEGELGYTITFYRKRNPQETAL